MWTRFGTLLLVVALCLPARVARATPPRKLTLAAMSTPSATIPLAGKPAVLTAGATITVSGKALRLDEDRQLVINRYAHVVEGNRAYFVLEYKQTDPKEVERMRQSMYNVPGKTDLTIRSPIHMAAVDLDKAEVVWRADLSNMQCEGGWEVLDAPSVFYVRTLTTAYAVAKGSGRYKWMLDSDPLEGVLNERYLLGWKVVDKSFVFETVNRVDYDPAKTNWKTLEIDMETGDRVYRVTPVPRVPLQPVYVYHHTTVEYRGDRPSPQLPKHFDGVRLERTVFLWNKDTAEGIIVNPQRALLDQIVDVALRQTIDGKPVAWKYVVDLVAANRTFGSRMKAQVLVGHRDTVGETDEIFLEARGEFEHSGEKIAAAEVAKRLGSAVLASSPPEKTPLRAAPLFIYRDKMVGRAALADRDIPFNLQLKWGPYVLHERSYDRPYLKMEP